MRPQDERFFFIPRESDIKVVRPYLGRVTD